ncbi:MAG TPA: SAM-dependent methyltransferase [Trebonia sp.]|nr:SAM-dependent methyltransferase [Trebonia sp.]
MAGGSGDGTMAGIDLSRPHPARMYDYYLGGKDHFAIDRETAERGLASWPAVRTATRENRKYLARVVDYLAREAGIRQFLDIGTGLPTAGNTHEVAQAIAPDSRIMYVDNDPLVLAHARALLTSSPQGRTGYIEADLREPGRILADPMVGEVLDLSKPVALMLIAILHFIADSDDPGGIVATLLDGLAPGSYLVATSVTPEHDPDGVHGLERTYREGGMTLQARTADDFGHLVFSGLELVPPGMVLVSEWRPDEDGPRPRPADVSVYGAVGRKPAGDAQPGSAPPGGKL